MIHLKPIRQKTTVILGVTAVFFCLIFGFRGVVHAQSVTNESNTVLQGLQSVQEPLGMPAEDIRVIVARIIKVALGLVGIVFILLIIYGGYLYMTAGGNEEQIGSAKKVLINAAIGLFIVLSAYSIVLFVAKMLGLDGETNSSLSDGVGSVGENDQNFIGSGALGRVISDHYPSRDQKDVARNTKIIITFKKPIDLASFAENTNGSKDASGNDLLGDCINTSQSQDWKIDWKKDCDALKQGAVVIKQVVSGEEVHGNVMASAENGKVYTIEIRPYETLGNNADKIQYSVVLGNNLMWAEGGRIFENRPIYDWKFTTGNELDVQPPYVVSYYPEPNTTAPKNSVIQVTFSEPMSPYGLQGSLSNGADYYPLSGNTVFVKSGNSTVPLGTFRLSNGYKTLEFTPSKECGQNACGEKVYCLPVCDKGSATCQSDTYNLLIKAAQTSGGKDSFEARPFSGAMDLAGNALDGNHNGIVDTAPSTGPVFPDQTKPDNSLLVFNVENKVDLTPPYLKQVTPGPEAEEVGTDDAISFLFSKRMRVEPMYSIGLDQSPATTEGVCKVPRLTFNEDKTTLVELQHCPLVKKDRYFYMPSVTSDVQDVNFNCFFPGKGPVGIDANKASRICDQNNPAQCCEASVDKAFCCNGIPNQTTKDKCLEDLSAK